MKKITKNIPTVFFKDGHFEIKYITLIDLLCDLDDIYIEDLEVELKNYLLTKKVIRFDDKISYSALEGENYQQFYHKLQNVYYNENSIN